MANISKEGQECVRNMQLLEPNIQCLFSQRQQLQQQLTEIESALSSSENSNKMFKIIGNIMVAVEKNELVKELKEESYMDLSEEQQLKLTEMIKIYKTEIVRIEEAQIEMKLKMAEAGAEIGAQEE